MSDSVHVTIIISYSDETKEMIDIVKRINEKKTLIIAINGISKSTLDKMSQDYYISPIVKC
ncbi:SIS domain-containing protein [Eggerthia catenaformis]